MTTTAEIEVTTDDHQKKTKKGFFGSTKTTKTEQDPPEQAKKEPSDDGSVASTSSTKKATTTNWYGKQVKRPRAEYQAEIDELKLQIAELQVNLETKTNELQQFKDWVGMAPSAF
mmetsp:Transcript_16331/g.40944  ORF Transcript_16331/g.40944 Transcript_16331/m.40944 type:complete len:115 (-) Transcript_16331:112-456(-)